MKKYHQSGGFVIVEVIIVVVVAALVGFIVWRAVTHQTNPVVRTNDGSDASKVNAKAEELTRQITTAQPEAQTQTEDTPSSSSTNPSKSATLNFRAVSDGFKFSYPNTWTSKVWSNYSDSSGITITSPTGGILLSFGSPVVAPAPNCTATNNFRITILAVKAVSSIGTPRQLYLIDYVHEDFKSIALTDWDGQEPKVGQTDKCDYQPAFLSPKTGGYAWFKISGESDAYQQLSADAYFNLPEVSQVRQILASGTYK